MMKHSAQVGQPCTVSQPSFAPGVWLRCLLIVAVSAAATGVSVALQLDVRIARALYDGDPYWIAGHRQPWFALYEYGPWPGVAICAIAGMVAALRWRRRQSPEFRAAAFVLLTALIANVIVIEVGLKGFAGRPRPRDLAEFGGSIATSDAGFLGPIEWNSSFPSGHAAIGFLLMTPAFLVSNPAGRRVIRVSGFAAGCLIGFARMLQGAHFLTDILWAFAIVHVTASCVWFVVIGRQRTDSEGPAAVDAVRGPLVSRFSETALVTTKSAGREGAHDRAA